MGAGTSDYKFSRGFEPSLVHSVHWMRDPALHAAVAGHVASQRAQLRDALGRLDAKAVMKPRPEGRRRAEAMREQINSLGGAQQPAQHAGDGGEPVDGDGEPVDDGDGR